jgi:hypothetical protein
MPSPVQIGLYRETSGTTSASGEKGSQLSIAIVATWRTTNVPTSRPPKRCTSSSAKRGHRCIRFFPARPRPSDTTADRST